MSPLSGAAKGRVRKPEGRPERSPSSPADAAYGCNRSNQAESGKPVRRRHRGRSPKRLAPGTAQYKCPANTGAGLGSIGFTPMKTELKVDVSIDVAIIVKWLCLLIAMLVS